MREIKFRCWYKPDRKMVYEESYISISIDGTLRDNRAGDPKAPKFTNPMYGAPLNEENHILMQYTGLKDKNGLTEIYEGDIIGVDGIKKGDIYESPNLLEEKSNLIIPTITSKDWQTTYKEAMERGCQHAK